MSIPEKVTQHIDLVYRMAETAGADVPGAMARGTLDIAEWATVVRRCTGCACPETCGGWLDATKGQRADPPSFCRNTDFMERMRR